MMGPAHPFAGLLGHPTPELSIPGRVHWCDGRPPHQDEDAPPLNVPEPKRYVGRPLKEAESPEQAEQRRKWREAYLRRRAIAIAKKRRLRDLRLQLGNSGIDIDRVHQPTTPKGL